MNTVRNAAIVFLLALGAMITLLGLPEFGAADAEPGTNAYDPRSGGTITGGTAPYAAYYTAANTLSSTSALQFTATEVVVNEAGSATMDFRAEGDTADHLLFVDASADRVGIGGAATPGATLDVTGQVFSAQTHPLLFVIAATQTNITASTEVNAVRINLSAVQQHATGALTALRDLLFTGAVHSAVGASAVTFMAGYDIEGPKAGDNITAGSLAAVSITPGTVVTGSGVVTNAYGLRVATPAGAVNNYNSIFTGGGFVGINTTAPTTMLHFNSGAANTVAIETFANTAGDCQIFRVDATPEGAVTGSICDTAYDGTNGVVYLKATGNATNTGWVAFASSAVTVGAGTAPQAAYYTAATTIGSTAALEFQATEVVVNNSGSAAMDFRVEGDTNANLIFADASTDRVGIGTAAPASQLEIYSADAGATINPILTLYRDSASPAASDDLGAIKFEGNSTTAVRRTYGQIDVDNIEPTNAAERAEIGFSLQDGGALTQIGSFFSFGDTLGSWGFKNAADSSTAQIAFIMEAEDDWPADKPFWGAADVAGNDINFGILGEGLIVYGNQQLRECSVTATLDPQSSQITIDAGGAGCVVTLQETTAASFVANYAVTGLITTINVFNVGVGKVTFPDVANVAAIPVLCSTTGLGENGTLSLMYVDRANDLWVATGCIDPAI